MANTEFFPNLFDDSFFDGDNQCVVNTICLYIFFCFDFSRLLWNWINLFCDGVNFSIRSNTFKQFISNKTSFIGCLISARREIIFFSLFLGSPVQFYLLFSSIAQSTMVFSSLLHFSSSFRQRHKDRNAANSNLLHMHSRSLKPAHTCMWQFATIHEQTSLISSS